MGRQERAGAVAVEQGAGLACLNGVQSDTPTCLLPPARKRGPHKQAQPAPPFAPLPHCPALAFRFPLAITPTTVPMQFNQQQASLISQIGLLWQHGGFKVSQCMKILLAGINSAAPYNWSEAAFLPPGFFDCKQRRVLSPRGLANPQVAPLGSEPWYGACGVISTPPLGASRGCPNNALTSAVVGIMLGNGGVYHRPPHCNSFSSKIYTSKNKLNAFAYVKGVINHLCLH
ncbi:uncharacterized protein PSFLO_00136 [Pseudozyma flocculosa]|uniref:Uncharacterized protein n=1 Tax=Pseudozyma flocculosa TaxID=84751 RepID=A0A5C3ESJ0_9BASI|nr:uncharacterized protein PSFLO_00136 [Pseudozyma flocculosa]